MTEIAEQDGRTPGGMDACQRAFLEYVEEVAPAEYPRTFQDAEAVGDWEAFSAGWAAGQAQ
jgi:hypothetical protein